jgi:hypothetical protein
MLLSLNRAEQVGANQFNYAGAAWFFAAPALANQLQVCLLLGGYAFAAPGSRH